MPEEQELPGLVPRPDPTLLTTQALEREIEQLRTQTEKDLHGAIEALNTKMVGHFLVDNERFSNMGQRFVQVESQRIEQKRDTKEAVDAALTAQKEAIAKSETGTSRQIEQLMASFNTEIASMAESLSDLKERAGRLESFHVGGREAIAGFQAWMAIAAVILVGVMGFLAAHYHG